MAMTRPISIVAILAVGLALAAPAAGAGAETLQETTFLSLPTSARIQALDAVAPSSWAAMSWTERLALAPKSESGDQVQSKPGVPAAAAVAGVEETAQEKLEREAMEEAIQAPRMDKFGRDRSAPQPRGNRGAGRVDDARPLKYPLPATGAAVATAGGRHAETELPLPPRHAATANATATATATAATRNSKVYTVQTAERADGPGSGEGQAAAAAATELAALAAENTLLKDRYRLLVAQLSAKYDGELTQLKHEFIGQIHTERDECARGYAVLEHKLEEAHRETQLCKRSHGSGRSHDHDHDRGHGRGRPRGRRGLVYPSTRFW